MPLNADNWEVRKVYEPSKMMVMPSNSSGLAVGRLVGMYPNRLGWLISPDGWRNPPSWMPYALDNGAYSAFKNKTQWNEIKFMDLLQRASKSHLPLWVVVPDVVMDKQATINQWYIWAPKIKKILPRVKLAFAVQDGMSKNDVPHEADVVFVGGSTEWKWKHLRTWTENFASVHVARVNSGRMLWMADDCGAQSCDGTGWMRGGENRLRDLENYLKESNANGRKQMVMEEIF